MKNNTRLPPVDTAWLRMDTPENLMIVNFVIEFKDRISLEQFQEIIKTRFLTHDRFNRTITKRLTGYYLEETNDLNIERHVKKADNEQLNNQLDLQLYVSQLFSQSLDPCYPMWEFQHVANYNQGSAIIGRIHHCYADGIALMTLLFSLVDGSTPGIAVSESKGQTFRTRLHQRGHYGRPSIKTLLKQNPTVLLQEALRYPRDLLKVATLNTERNHKLKQTLTGNKKIAWSDSIPLQDVKSVSKKMGCTVNDVLVGCVARMLMQYLDSQGQENKLNSLRATLPVNIRPLNKGLELGNKFGLVYLDLPFNQHSVKATVEATHRMMNELKHSKQPIVSFLTLGALGAIPSTLQKRAVDYFSTKASMVLTYLPGPKKIVSIADKRIDSIISWVPQTGEIGLGISLVSYNHRVLIGIMVDEAIVQDPSELVKRYKPTFERLKEEVIPLPPSENQRHQIETSPNNNSVELEKAM